MQYSKLRRMVVRPVSPLTILWMYTSVKGSDVVDSLWKSLRSKSIIHARTIWYQWTTANVHHIRHYFVESGNSLPEICALKNSDMELVNLRHMQDWLTYALETGLSSYILQQRCILLLFFPSLIVCPLWFHLLVNHASSDMFMVACYGVLKRSEVPHSHTIDNEL